MNGNGTSGSRPAWVDQDRGHGISIEEAHHIMLADPEGTKRLRAAVLAQKRRDQLAVWWGWITAGVLLSLAGIWMEDTDPLAAVLFASIGICCLGHAALKCR